MKEYFVNKSFNLIISKYNYDQDMKDRIKYGLETIYISITKISIILLLSLILGLIKETVIFMIFLNGLRMFSYGLHAKKSWHCYLFSSISFVLMPYVFININFMIYQKIILCIYGIISMILFAPADTKKRPLISKKLRSKLKYESIGMCIIYCILLFIIDNQLISNLILLSIITQSIIINPFTYKLFGLSYNNYKKYNSGV